LLDNGYYYVAIGIRKGLLMVNMRERKQQKQEAGAEERNVKGKMKEKSIEQEENDKNPIDGIRVSELLTDMRLWKNKDRYET
jgi:hypothetical protein